MADLFKTFKPENILIKKYVDYYYIDIKPDNDSCEFQCFPHFNNTVSLYKSHLRLDNGDVIYSGTDTALQIFTPIRQKVLNVRQTGKVHRIVIVFHPLGIQQFYKELNFADYITDFDFFKCSELRDLFSTIETDRLSLLLDRFLEQRFNCIEHSMIHRSVEYIFRNYENFSVTDLSKDLGISRQHLNRNFRSHLGVSVKKFHEIVVFRMTVNHKLFENPGRNFTELAHEFNYNDQSHLNKAYKNFTENSPKSFFNKGTVLGTEDTFWCLR